MAEGHGHSGFPDAAGRRKAEQHRTVHSPYSPGDNLDLLSLLEFRKRKKIERILERYVLNLSIEVKDYNKTIYSISYFTFPLIPPEPEKVSGGETVFNPLTGKDDILAEWYWNGDSPLEKKVATAEDNRTVRIFNKPDAAQRNAEEIRRRLKGDSP